jgi:hypothetical protein
MNKSEIPAMDKQADGDSMGHRRRWVWIAFAGGSLVLLAVIAVGVLLHSGSDDPTLGDRPSWVAHNRHQAQYTAGIASAWPQYESDKPVGAYLESAWHDPETWQTTFEVDSRHSDKTGSPMATAQLARVEARQVPSFRERGLEGVRLRGHPAVRWTYDIAGKPHVSYFFEECGTSIVTRGSSPPKTLGNFTEDFRGMSFSIEVRCGE